MTNRDDMIGYVEILLDQLLWKHVLDKKDANIVLRKRELNGLLYRYMKPSTISSHIQCNTKILHSQHAKSSLDHELFTLLDDISAKNTYLFTRGSEAQEIYRRTRKFEVVNHRRSR